MVKGNLKHMSQWGAPLNGIRRSDKIERLSQSANSPLATQYLDVNFLWEKGSPQLLVYCHTIPFAFNVSRIFFLLAPYTFPRDITFQGLMWGKVDEGQFAFL